jgi:hypothetical protein
VEAMKQLWSELVDYHNFYLPGVTTNMSKASHLYLSLLPCLVFSFSNASHLHTSVQAKWTGSKIIKYRGNAFRLHTWLSVLKESCPSFHLHLLSLLPQSYSSFLSSAHQSWDATQDKARKWQRDPTVKRRWITKKWGNTKANSSAAKSTTYHPESQKRPKKRAHAEKEAPLLYNHVLMPCCRPAHEWDDPFAFISDESDSDVSSMPSPSDSSSE